MKKALFQFCQDYIDTRLERIQSQIAEVKLALTSESKSTAGDKHETGRAMLQLEREKLGQQLLEAERIQHLLSRVPLKTNTNKVALGSLVYTDKASYYIAISAGQFNKLDTSAFCISANTPIAKLLLGKSVNDTFEFNGNTFKILKIS